ncbi:MAG TPA: cytochrome c oxidase assembly protein, partial [Gemmatimonadaceae bacterium]
MQWWCSAQGIAWTWTWRPYVGVWLMVLALAVWYWRSYTRAAQRWHGAHARLRTPRVAAAITGIALLWIALDWPIGTLGAGYLASVHMVQFFLIAMIAPALLVFGWPPSGPALPDGSARAAHPGAFHSAVNSLTHPVVAIIIFDAAVVATHAPPVVDSLMGSQAGSFLLDMTWLLAGVIFWWPLTGGPFGRAPLRTPLDIAYIFASSLSHTGVSMYLLLARFPVYSTYELAPPISGISKLTDQNLAGGLMLLGGAAIVLGAISVVFFKWQAEMEREERGERGERDSRKQTTESSNGSDYERHPRASGDPG